MRRSLLLFAAPLFACQPPPPAPEGLDASSAHMVREFYSDDALFQAGLQGFMQWFEEEGRELMGVDNTAENVNEFQLQPLTDAEVAYMPLNHGRDIGIAAGVVSLAVMNCPIAESEELLLRRDQDVIFDDWEGYEREFLTPRAEYVAGWTDGFDAIPDVDAPYDGFDGSAYSSALLQTDNMVNASPVPLVGDFDPYPMHLDFRHGTYDIAGEPMNIFSILTFIEDSVTGPAGNNHLYQSYSVELNAELQDGETLRTLAVWIEGASDGVDIDPDDPLILNSALNKSKKASQRMTEVCEGTYEIPAERAE